MPSFTVISPPISYLNISNQQTVQSILKFRMSINVSQFFFFFNCCVVVFVTGFYFFPEVVQLYVHSFLMLMLFPPQRNCFSSMYECMLLELYCKIAVN